MLDPVDAAFEEGFKDGVSGPDSGPEVKGEAGRGEACERDTIREDVQVDIIHGEEQRIL